MANSPVVVIGLTYRDRDANRAKMTFYSPWNITIADVWDLAYSVAGAAGGLSNAVLDKIEILYRWKNDETGIASDDSSVERKLLLLITNDAGDINGMIIPSPISLFELVGSYAGIRVDLMSPAIVAFQDMLSVLDFRTDDDRQLGQIVVAGGLAL